MKRCTVCQEEKGYDHYHNSKATKDGYGYRCKGCDRAARLQYREDNYERFLEVNRKKQLKCKYNLSVEDYETMLVAQSFSCAICQKHVNDNNGPSAKNGSQRLAVDHDHVTKNIRGLLCNNCNRALGLFNDDPELLVQAKRYLSLSGN